MQVTAIACVMVLAAVMMGLLGLLAIVRPVAHLVLILMVTSCAVTMVTADVVFVCVRTTPYGVAPTVNCVQ